MTVILRAATCCIAALFAPLAAAQSIEEMAGQLVLVGFQGDSVDAAGVAAVREQIAAGQVGSVMFLRVNVESLDAVRAMNAAFLAARPDLPPFTTLDQEGGQINRLSSAVGFGQIPSAEGMTGRPVEEAEAIYADLAQRLSAHGFTVNFGPVVDLNLNRANPIIARYERAFSPDPDIVTAYGSAFVRGHRAAGMATALKHFPGHGSSADDTHDGFVDVTGLWQPEELEPYRRLIADDLVDMIMVAHIFNADYAGEEPLQLPASLSPEWIEGVLRGELGYDGVVISDDMQMGAVRQFFDMRETIVRSVMAGNDILLFSNTADYRPELGAEMHAILVEEAQADPAFAARIEQSYRRIVALKERLAVPGL